MSLLSELPSPGSSPQPIERPRVVYRLKRDVRQLLVLTEDDVVYISAPLKNRSAVRELETSLLDLSAQPSQQLGPAATRIPLTDIERTKMHPVRRYLDIETADAVHRIGGWSKPAVFATPTGLKRTALPGPTGAIALQDIEYRVSARRHGRPEMYPLPDPVEVQADQARPISPTDEIPEYTHLSIPDLLATLRSAVIAICFLLGVIFLTGPRRWYLGFIALIELPRILLFHLPSRLKVLSTGLSWGVGAGRRHLSWSEVERFEVPTMRRFGFATEPIQVIMRSTGMRVLQPHTKWLRPDSLAGLTEALSRHRPCGPRGADPIAGAKPRLRTKPVIENKAIAEPRWKFWAFAVPLAILVPILLLLPLILSVN